MAKRLLPIALVNLASFCGVQALSAASFEPVAFSLTSDSLTTAYTQNFDTLANAGTSTNNSSGIPTGWGFREVGTGPLADGLYGIQGGTNTSGNVYSLGSDGNSDRAFGTLFSNSVTPSLFSAFTNNTGSTLVALTITYTGEQWRFGQSGRATADQLDFAYSTDATSTETGLYTDVDSLDFVGPINTGTVGALNGNAAANRREGITFTISNLTILQGQTFYFRFSDINVAGGSDDALGIDDFSLSLTAGATPKNLVYNPPGSQLNTDPANLNFLDGTTPVAFTTGSVLSFTDAGLAAGSTVVVDDAGVTTNGVTVSNTTGTYTLNGGALLGSGGLTKTGAGVLVLNNAGNLYAGSTVVSGGELRLGVDDALPNGSVKVEAGATLNVNGRGDTIGALTVENGTLRMEGGLLSTGPITLTGATITNGDIAFSSTISVLTSPNATVISANLDATGSVARAISVVDGAAAEDLIINGSFVQGAGGVGRTTFNGTGTVRLNGDSSTYTGGFSVNNPTMTLVIGNARALGLGSFNMNGGTVSAAMAMTIDSTNFSIGGNVTFAGADLTLSGFSSAEVPVGFSLFGTGAKTLTVSNNLTVTTDILKGIGGTGANPPVGEDTIRKAGTGTLTFSGNNSYLNGTQIIQGTMVAASNTALAAGPVSLNPAADTTATLRFTSPTPTISSLASNGEGTSSVILGTTGVNTVLSLGGTSTGAATSSAIYAGSLQQATGAVAGVRKIEAQLQALNGTSSYSGTTVVEEGTLSIGGALSGTSGVTVGGFNVPATLAGQGSITVAPGGAVTIASDGTLAPGDTVDQTGTLTLTAPSVSLNGALNLTFGSTSAGGSRAPLNAGLNDSVNLLGSLTLGPTASITGSFLTGFTTTIGDLFFVVVNDGTDAISGQFASLAQGSTVSFGGFGLDISYLGDATTGVFSATGGNDIALRVVSVPEPATSAFLLAGIAASAFCRRRSVKAVAS